MATFPAYARIIDQGFSEEADYGVLRSEMDGGIAKQRARFSKAIVTRDMQIQVMTHANKELFVDWMATDLRGGAGWFAWTDPHTSATKQARIVGGKLKWTTQGSIWLGQCQIETIG